MSNKAALDDSMDAVFHALAHPARRRMLDLVRSGPGARVGQVCERFEMRRIGATKHLNILEAAGLIVSRQDGRTRLLYVNAVPIQMIYDRWISDWSSLWAHEITSIKHRAESSGSASQNVDQDERTAASFSARVMYGFFDSFAPLLAPLATPK